MTKQGFLLGGLHIRKKPSLYTSDQVLKWLQCLKWPWPHTSDQLAGGGFPTTFRNLAALVRCHAVTFCYENLEMHYSESHKMDIDPQHLFRRLVTERRGSYCFGLNILFLWMLRGLGYRAYASLGRVNEMGDFKRPPEFTGLSHMVIFVQLGEESNDTYFVDVGCGGSGPTMPILLSDAEENVVIGTTGAEKHRLRRGIHPESVVDSSEWILEVSHENSSQDASAWRIVYMFSEHEAFQTDFELSNRGRYTEGAGFFADQVICSIHHWMDEDVEQNVEPSERRMIRIGLMGRLLKQFTGSRAEFIKLVYTEEERVDVIRKYFGIDLSKEEVECIRGSRAAI